jgi:hypothetical protein
VLGGWPPLGAPYDGILQATLLKQANPEPSSLKVLRSKEQYRQWETFYSSMLGWSEADSVGRIACPKMVYFGADGDLVEAEQRPTLEQMNWTVHEIGGQGHGVCMAPELVVPPVRDFLDLLAI